MYQLIHWGPYTCPGGNWQSARVSIGRGTILSVGFQNYGSAQNFWTSQLFVMSATEAFAQVVNNSMSGTQWLIWAVVDTGASGADEDPEQLKGPEPDLETQKYEGNGPA